MLTLAQFREAFPEFVDTADALVSSALSRAQGQIDPAVWVHLTNEGHGLLTAHLLALSPFGGMARLQSDKGTSTYGTRYQKLLEAATAGLRLV